MRSFRIDMTYGFQEHGIVIAKDLEGMDTDLHCAPKESGVDPEKWHCQKNCRFYNQCAKQKDISWAGLKLTEVLAHFPEDIKFDRIIGAHTGQCNMYEMFKTWDFSDIMVAYGVNQNAALCLRHANGCIDWCAFELENTDKLDEESKLRMIELSKILVECLGRPVYMCSNGINPYLIPL